MLSGPASERRAAPQIPEREGAEDRELVILAASRLGKTRLIDNLEVSLA